MGGSANQPTQAVGGYNQFGAMQPSTQIPTQQPTQQQLAMQNQMGPSTGQGGAAVPPMQTAKPLVPATSAGGPFLNAASQELDPTKGTGQGGMAAGPDPAKQAAYNQSQMPSGMPQGTGQGGMATPPTQQPNPFQQAAAAQNTALGTTQAATQYRTNPLSMGTFAAGTQYQTDPNVMSRMTQGMGYRPPSAATGAMTQGTGYQVNPLAQQGFGAAMEYQPSQVQSTAYSAAQVGTPDAAASRMAQYQNPYESQVIQSALRDIGTQQEKGLNRLGASAQAAGAFGGSRHGIAEAEAMKGYGQQMADTASRMRQQGFDTALGAAQFDVGQEAAAAARNQAAMNAARQFGALQGMTSQQLNQAAGLQGAGMNLQGAQALSGADLAAAGQRLGAAGQLAGTMSGAESLGMSAAGQLGGMQRADMATQLGAAGQLAGQQRGDVSTQLNAAQQLANLGQQSFGYGQDIQSAIGGQGRFQRGLQQSILDRAMGQYGGATGAPMSGLGALSSILSGVPYGTTATSSTPFNPLGLLGALL